MAMTSCCASGFKWDGKPKGSESKLANNPAYVTGSNKEAAVLIVHDIFGWTLNNTRLLADHYAEEADATVFLPDFFDGMVVPPERLSPDAGGPPFDIGAFLSNHGPDKRWPEVEACVKAMRDQGFKKIGCIGFCYGGFAMVRLASKKNKLVDCMSAAHPALFDKSDIDALGGCPVQWIAPEEDNTFTPELKEHVLKVMPTLGVDWDYQYFAGLKHGFATRGDQNDAKQRKGLERAKNVASAWFAHYLH